MKNTLGKGALLITLILLFLKVQAQDPAFSQFYAAGLYLNPALAGVESAPALVLNYRNQWRSLQIEPYVTSQLSLLLPFYSKGTTGRQWGGAGLSVYNDQAGAGNLNITGLSANFAYIVPLAKKHDFILALRGGVIYKTIDPGNLQWGSQYDPNIGFNKALDDPIATYNIGVSKIMPEIGAGFLYYFNGKREIREKGLGFFIGGSAYHLNQPDESFIGSSPDRLAMLLKAQAGVELTLSPKIVLSPNALFAFQDAQYQMNVGMYLRYMLAGQKKVFVPTDFILGAWYRLEDAAILSIGFGNSYYTLGFSYDVNSSNLKDNTKGRGAYEISLKIRKPRGRKEIYQTPRI